MLEADGLLNRLVEAHALQLGKSLNCVCGMCEGSQRFVKKSLVSMWRSVSVLHFLL